jgi:predicted dehydrogenase
MKTIQFGVIGLGYWGPNYVRIFNELDETKLKYCCDLEDDKLEKLEKCYNSIEITKDYRDMIQDPKLDAVVIITPPNTHYSIGRDCLEHDKHVLIEKPLATNSKDCEELIKLADEKKKILMVGHVYKYNPGVRKIKDIISSGEIGKIFYCSAIRIGLGPIRKHASALWDLAIHDVTIATYILNSLPDSVNAIGESYIQGGIEDVVFLTFSFPDKIKYNINVSWYSPEKIRETLVVGSKKMVIFDDVNKSETIKIFERILDKGLLNSTPRYSDHQLIVKEGDIYIPRVEQSEPLKNQVKHFIKCIKNNEQPLSNGNDGLNIVRILEAAERSMKNNGITVKL